MLEIENDLPQRAGITRAAQINHYAIIRQRIAGSPLALPVSFVRPTVLPAPVVAVDANDEGEPSLDIAMLLAGLKPGMNRIEIVKIIVARFYKFTVADLTGKCRKSCVVRPRQIALYLAKIISGRSLPEIGRRFGGRDHATVFHACRKYQRLVKESPELAAEIDVLRTIIAEALQ